MKIFIISLIVTIPLVISFGKNKKKHEALKYTYPIIDTGQTNCYGVKDKIDCPKKGKDLYGQDAQYDNYKSDYQDKGDGTILDRSTGLMWTKSFKKMSWKEAQDMAKKEKTGKYNDWRVPTIKEIYSLIDFNGTTGLKKPYSKKIPLNARPYINTTFFDFEYPTSEGRRYIDAQYISKTSYVHNVMQGQEAFFGVNFADGRIKGYPKDGRRKDWYIRFVRGNTEYGKNIFIKNENDTVTDKSTGLMWTRIDSGSEKFKSFISQTIKKSGALNWPEALSFCEKLEFGGYQDWYLPNAKELHSLVDYTRSPQTSRSAAISPLFMSTAIKDEGGKKNYPFYWTSTTHLDGPILGANAVYISFGEALGLFSLGGKTHRHRNKQMKPLRRPRGAPIGQKFIPFSGQKKIMDVHGAGAQRSDPKMGRPAKSRGPQGDIQRIYNHVRCVRKISK